jgi:hypothetical protein
MTIQEQIGSPPGFISAIKQYRSLIRNYTCCGHNRMKLPKEGIDLTCCLFLSCTIIGIYPPEG